jgi:hypothetical protein
MNDKLLKPPKRDKDVVAFQGFAGLRNEVEPHRFEKTDLAVAVNVYCDATGALARRDGLTSVYSGTPHSLWSDNATALFAEGMSLKQLAADYSVTVLDTITVSDPISYTKVNDQIYWSNATDNGVIDDGAARSWGMAVPAVSVATAGVGGSMPAGVYQYTVTHIRSDGQESGAGPARTITVAANGSLTFPVPASSDPNVAYKRVYLSLPDGDVLYRASLIANATLTTSYTLDTSEFESGDELETQFLSPPPAGQLVGYFQGATYVAVGSDLFHSEPHAHELFNLKKYLPFADDITMFAPLEDEGVFIGTTTAVYWLAGKDPMAFTAVQRMAYGAIEGALAYVEGTKMNDGGLGTKRVPVWLSAQGVCIGLPGGAVDNLTSGRYTLSSSGTGAAMYHDGVGQVLFSREADGFAMSTKNPGFTKFEDWAFNSMALFNDLYFGAKDDGIFLLSGSDEIDAVFRTGTTDFGTSHLKRIERLWVQYETAGEMTLTVITDGGVRTEYTLPPTGSTGMHGHNVKIGQGLKSKYWAFEIANVDGCSFSFDMIEAKPYIMQRRHGGGNA